MMNNKNIDKVAADTKLLLEHLDNLTQQLHSAGLKITFGSIVVVDERNDFTIASHKPKPDVGGWMVKITTNTLKPEEGR